MKNFLNFLGNKINEYEEDWDELEDSDFEDDSERYTDEEYYSDDTEEVEGEYYADEYADGQDEVYADEYADGQGEVYTDESDCERGGYYSEENIENEDGYPEESDEIYYIGNVDSDEYYADDESVDASYYDDEEYYEEEWDEPVGGNVFDKIKCMFANMDMVDRVVTCTGVAVLILALITGTVFAGNRLVAKQVNSFDAVGAQLEGITVIGGDGLVAIADAQIARQEAAGALMDQENESYDEEEYSNEVTVELNMTSIKKDLKIKFVNKKTGKLIANIPFAVDVTDSNGKTFTWTDDDKDGIIYKTDIAHGEYTVAMHALEGYDDYRISTAAKPVNVKEKLDYEKVDVSDEIKTEAEIDASKEDTAKNEVEQESSLQDTVAWVESTKTASGETYVEVAKTTIEEPKVARFDNFVKLAGTNGETVSISGGSQVSATGNLTLNASTSGFKGDVTYSWSVSDTVASIEGSNTGSTITLKANNAATTSQTVTVSVTATSTFSGEVSGNTTTTTYSDTASVTITIDAKPVDVALSLDKTNASIAVNNTLSLALTVTGDAGNITWSSDKTDVASVQGTNTGATVKGLKAGTATITASGGGKSVSCTVTVTDTAVTLKLDKTAGTVAVKGTLEVSAVISGGTAKGTVSWSSDRTDVATVTGDKTKATITGVKAGDAVITAKYAEGSTIVTATCTVKVTDAAVTLKLDKTSGTILVGNTLEIIPAITGNLTDTAKIVWTSDKPNVATVTGDNTKATVKGVATGDAIITATYTEGSATVTATCAVKVQTNPALDTKTALKDKNGNQIYVLNASGQYVAATYADYFKANQKFYLKQQGYKYTGWQTLDGGVYYFDANGNKVTGAQVIQGAQYSFDSNGKMVSSNGILGIDVSKWNGSIDWNAVKNSGVSYVIIRCGYRGSSQGSLVEDPKYRTNIQGATSAGLKVGVYFFTQAINEIEAVEEASMVLSLVKGYKISYPIFLDVESSGGRADGISKATRTEVCKAFCQTIKNSGYTAGIYANKTWLNNYIDAGQLGAYRIWLAQYAAKPTYSGRYDIWQYSSKGKVGGISGNVDMNLSYMGY